MMNIKITINPQLSTIESKKQTKQTSRTETESQIWRSFGGLSVGREKGEIGEKGAGVKKHNWQVPNRQGEVKNSIGNGKAKELICTTHGHERRGWEEWWREGGYQAEGDKGGKNWDNCNSTINKI